MVLFTHESTEFLFWKVLSKYLCIQIVTKLIVRELHLFYKKKHSCFQIIKNNGHPNVDFKIVAENVEQNDDGKTEIPNKIEYTIHVREVGKLEVLGLKTELTAGSDAVPFGVAGYDKDENEFDTLDGLQISW